jgi:hypothetical protein
MRRGWCKWQHEAQLRAYLEALSRLDYVSVLFTI